MDGFDIFDPVAVCVKDSILVLSTEYVLYSYDLESGSLKKLIEVGDGPCEVVDFTSIGLSETSKVWVYDGNVGKYIIVDLDEFHKDAIMVPKLMMLNELQPISSNRLIGVPYGKSVGYYLLNTEGEIIDSLTYFPPKPKNISDWTHSFACSGRISVSSDGQHFARSVAKDGGVDFFELKDEKIHHIARCAEFDMEYTVDVNDPYPLPITTDKSRCGYYSLTNTDNGFMALFSPLRIHDNINFSSTEIHTFSNDGNLKKKIKLDFALASIVWDSANNQVIGVTGGGGPSGASFLVKFNI
ncbi:MAG: BF3164 family lipoprotein [Bacteroidales bacterium]|nr:BF3164 family lipoprotein [Bacteroidales bacterium]